MGETGKNKIGGDEISGYKKGKYGIGKYRHLSNLERVASIAI